METPEWQPIETYEKDLWDPKVVYLRDDAGNEAVGSWGFEDESWNGEEEVVYGAWHTEDGLHNLPFEPTFWKAKEEPC